MDFEAFCHESEGGEVSSIGCRLYKRIRSHTFRPTHTPVAKQRYELKIMCGWADGERDLAEPCAAQNFVRSAENTTLGCKTPCTNTPRPLSIFYVFVFYSIAFLRELVARIKRTWPKTWCAVAAPVLFIRIPLLFVNSGSDPRSSVYKNG